MISIVRTLGFHFKNLKKRPSLFERVNSATWKEVSVSSISIARLRISIHKIKNSTTFHDNVNTHHRRVLHLNGDSSGFHPPKLELKHASWDSKSEKFSSYRSYTSFIFYTRNRRRNIRNSVRGTESYQWNWKSYWRFNTYYSSVSKLFIFVHCYAKMTSVSS